MRSKENKKVRAKGLQITNTFASLSETAGVSLEIATRKEQFHVVRSMIMSSLVFHAFTFEAYLNHIGEIRIKNWNYLESLKAKKKLDLVGKELGIKLEKGKRPWQTLDNLLDFRNWMAHGKTIRRKFDEILDEEQVDDFTLQKVNWQKYCTLDNAKRVQVDIGVLIATMNSKLTKREQELGRGFALSSFDVEEVTSKTV